jgi:hypothetical protein
VVISPVMSKDSLAAVIARIDEANSGDPNSVTEDGVKRPAGLVYGERMSEVLTRLYPDASELLALAARAQHIQRWTIPRSDYSMDRTGYLQWRNRLKQLHAGLAGEIMLRCGYESADIERVQSLLRKENLKRDPEAQALEDVVCIVFLEFYADEFAGKHHDEKMTAILRKTWLKMSERGRDSALALPLSPRLRGLVSAALSA